MVYQEQVMRILNRLGDIELSDAYSCIKAIGKKKLADIARFREQFTEGAVSRGLSKKDAADLFDMVEKFAGYGFNKSHSTAYALIAYMTAYLKAHYPVEFMAALLSGDIPHRNATLTDQQVCSRPRYGRHLPSTVGSMTSARNISGHIAPSCERRSRPASLALGRCSGRTTRLVTR